jgi:hypothetical protein
VTYFDQTEFYSITEFKESAALTPMALCETDCFDFGCEGDLICKTRQDQDGFRAAPGCSLYQTSTSQSSSLCVDESIYYMPSWIGTVEEGNNFTFDVVLGQWILPLNEQQDTKIPGIYWVTLETHFFNFDSTPVTTTYEV